jgi:dihydrofolate reductase
MDRQQGPEEIVILVAMTAAGVIGRDNTIPWHIPEELRLFRQLTVGHSVLMGRRTFESIGRPLPQRRNLVLSRSLSPAPGVEICPSFAEALARTAGEKLFIIGGRRLYAEALPVADALHISWIAGDYPGDVLFPPFSLADWEEVTAVEHPQFRHLFYRRRQ